MPAKAPEHEGEDALVQWPVRKSGFVASMLKIRGGRGPGLAASNASSAAACTADTPLQLRVLLGFGRVCSEASASAQPFGEVWFSDAVRLAWAGHAQL